MNEWISWENLPLWQINSLFFTAAAVIAVTGWKLSSIADRLADETHMGEALMGGMFLGATTSISGLMTSVSAAYLGEAQLSISNAIGGIAAQTAFLAIADISYRKINLEHTAASASNIMQASLLIILLVLPPLASIAFDLSIWGIHPVTLLMFFAYMYGMNVVNKAKNEPMWEPKQTPETQNDAPEEDSGKESLSLLWIKFLSLAVVLAAMGWMISRTGSAMITKTTLSVGVVGGIFTAVSTSLPELVTSIAAVRQGAYTLAVGNIIGGNAFDTLFLAVSDVSYRKGSLFHEIHPQQMFMMFLTILMTAVLIMGMMRRQKKGFANIGFESLYILLIYAFSIIMLFIGI